MVFHDRPVYQEEHAAQLIMARRPNLSPIEGRIHLRRPVDPPFAFPLQSCGGPYISGNVKYCLHMPPEYVTVYQISKESIDWAFALVGGIPLIVGILLTVGKLRFKWKKPHWFWRSVPTK